MSRGKFIVISGPSGVGKGTVVKKLLEENDNLALSVSATTREIRPGEIHGVNYFYITREEFEQKIKDNQMLEYTIYNGNYYGTIQSHVEEFLENGKTVILEIEVDGAGQVKSKIPEAVTIFLVAPSEAEIERRLRKRNTEDEETIQKRLKIAIDEMKKADSYDFVVCNDAVENAVDRILNIINELQ